VMMIMIIMMMIIAGWRGVHGEGTPPGRGLNTLWEERCGVRFPLGQGITAERCCGVGTRSGAEMDQHSLAWVMTLLKVWSDELAGRR
jgi:hypothetical protein